MADRLKSPIADPVRKPHRELEFDIRDLEDGADLPPIDKEDDFDIRIADDDDFDIQ